MASQEIHRTGSEPETLLSQRQIPALGPQILGTLFHRLHSPKMLPVWLQGSLTCWSRRLIVQTVLPCLTVPIRVHSICLASRTIPSPNSSPCPVHPVPPSSLASPSSTHLPCLVSEALHTKAKLRRSQRPGLSDRSTWGLQGELNSHLLCVSICVPQTAPPHPTALSLQPSKPHNRPVRKTHLTTCTLGNAQKETETYKLVFLSRLSWELPKYSNVRVKGVCIGEQFVRMRWRLMRVLSGTFEPKSKRRSSRRPGHCTVLASPSLAMDTMSPTTPVPTQRVTLGGVGE